MMYLDLAEIDQVLEKSRFWSRGRWSPARFKRADYLAPSISDIQEDEKNVTDEQSDLADAVRARVREEIGYTLTGPIRLLTNLRYFGYIINPISCYYCFSSGGALEVLLIEVTNTPWAERTQYVLDLRDVAQDQAVEFSKAMHVSPFMPMAAVYRWRGSAPDHQLRYSLSLLTDHFNAGEQGNTSEQGDDAAKAGQSSAFDSGVNFKRVEISRKSLNQTLLRYPLMTAKVVAAIHWEALRLSLKRVPFVPHPRGS